MGRYSEKYWDNRPTALEEAVGVMFTAGLINLIDEPLLHFCEITDTESGAVGKTEVGLPTKDQAHAVAWQNMIENRHEQEQAEIRRLKEEQAKKRNSNEETDFSAVLIKWGIYVALFIGALWLAFAVALPLVIINAATLALLFGFASTKNKIYFNATSVLGAIFVLIDYNNGLFTKTLVNNVAFFLGAIPYFLYLNITAGAVASYFLIRDTLNERNPPTKDDGEFTKRNIIIMSSLFVLLSSVAGAQMYFHSNEGFDYSSNQPTNNSLVSVPDSAQRDDVTVDTTAAGTVADTTKADNPHMDSTATFNNDSTSSPHNSNKNGHFTGQGFEIAIPQDFAVHPSIKSASGLTYESAFFESPDGEVEFYVFSSQSGEEPIDLVIDENIEKTTSTYSKKSKASVITWSEITALDGSYYRAYQDTRNPSGNIRWVVGLKYKSVNAYNKYKEIYLDFKKSLIRNGK